MQTCSANRPTSFKLSSYNKLFDFSKMPKVTINNKEYDTENMSEDAIRQLQSFQFTVGERQRLEAQLAVTKTAQAAYSKALQELLDESE